MERIKERKISAEQSLAALREALDMKADRIIRDATIQRFEFTVEAIWKFAQLYLRQKEGVDLASPKGVFRACFQNQIILKEEDCKLALEMVDDRNLTVHTYNEELAIKIYSHIPSYYSLMKKIFQSLHSKLDSL